MRNVFCSSTLGPHYHGARVSAYKRFAAQNLGADRIHFCPPRSNQGSRKMNHFVGILHPRTVGNADF